MILKYNSQLSQVKETKDKLRRWKMHLENSTWGPASKERGTFIMDFELKKFLLCVRPFKLSPPPKHFHLKTNNTSCLLTGTFLKIFNYFNLWFHLQLWATTLFIHCTSIPERSFQENRNINAVLQCNYVWKIRIRTLYKHTPDHVCPYSSQLGDSAHEDWGYTGGLSPSVVSLSLHLHHLPLLPHHSVPASPCFPAATGSNSSVFETTYWSYCSQCLIVYIVHGMKS